MLGIYCPPIANQIKPGQFVMLKVSDNASPLLSRPFSVYESYPVSHPEVRKRGHLFILYKKVGNGTKRMTTLSKGQKVDLIGPLGNGFAIPPLPSSAHCILVGEGVGIVSLYPLAEALRGRKCFVFIGRKTQDDIFGVEDFRKLNSDIFIATEDGSLGFRGTVVDLFLSEAKKFKGNERYHIYACGPATFKSWLARLDKRFPLTHLHGKSTRETLVKLSGHPVRTGQAHRAFPGTQWRAECVQRKFRSYCAPRPRLPLRRDGALAGQTSSFMTLGETKINKSFRLSSLVSLLNSQPNKGILLKRGTPSAPSVFETE
jgi:dihydroorotate dehydrogenase electron transfer subunit